MPQRTPPYYAARCSIARETREEGGIGGQMDYDYETILTRYREKYAHLAEEAALRSVERQTYEYILKWIDRNSTEPPEERAFQLTMTFLSLGKSAMPLEARAIYRQCGLDLNRDTGQEPWRF
jgi:hypothetical protein